MHENSLTEGLSDSQQAKLFRTLLLQMDREDITFKNLGGGQLSSRDLVVKLQTLTGIKAGPKVSALAPSPRREAVRWPSQAGRTPLALDTIGKRHEIPPLVFLCGDIHIGNLPWTKPFDALFNIKKFFPTPTDVVLKLPSQCHGWTTRLRSLGYKVSSRQARFGQQEHTLTKDGVSTILLQGGSTIVRNKRQWGTFMNPDVLLALREVGVLFEEKVNEKEFA